MSVENRPPNLENLDNCASKLRRAEEADANGATSGDEAPSPSVSPSIDDDTPTSDDMPDAMTASYSEIYQEGDDEDDDLLPGEISDLAEVQDATQGINELVDQINREELEGGAPSARANYRPQSLGVKASKPHQSSRLAASAMTDSQITSPGSSMMSAEEVFEDSPLQRHAHGVAGGTRLSELAGTLTYEGDMVSFVAEDLQKKIKLSSPVSKAAADGAPLGAAPPEQQGEETTSLRPAPTPTNVHMAALPHCGPAANAEAEPLEPPPPRGSARAAAWSPTLGFAVTITTRRFTGNETRVPTRRADRIASRPQPPRRGNLDQPGWRRPSGVLRLLEALAPAGKGPSWGRPSAPVSPFSGAHGRGRGPEG
ncbi:BLOC-1 related complex subunit 6 isoform X1 [Rhipicephalus microplus]|uniref:BLOC-1 related complex subunit 6 isoform X1 n=1 Tax=Rhipicephalus microplus TaxID=6941 RepID=UPI003F6B2E79